MSCPCNCPPPVKQEELALLRKLLTKAKVVVGAACSGPNVSNPMREIRTKLYREIDAALSTPTEGPRG